MPSRLARLLAIACACLGLTAGLAACGGSDDDKSVELTELPAEPQNNGAGGSGSGRLGTSTGGGASSDEGSADAGGSEGSEEPDGSEGDAAAGGGAAGGSTPVGQEIFRQSCAGCHTLADAGATGSVGPNLDDSRLDEAGIAAMVRSGGGGMPSFGGTLQPDQIDEVAAYVAAAKGS